MADAFANQQKNVFDSLLANVAILRALIESSLGVKENEIENLKNFLKNNLRKAVFAIPEDEEDIQDNIEKLFIGKGWQKGLDYDREVGRVKYSIKEYKPDFIISKLGLAIDVKLSKNKEKSKKIVDEINTDIMAYSKKYSNILFVVYDLGSIKNEEEFLHDLECKDKISVVIVKH